jgi:hypothetical protein
MQYSFVSSSSSASSSATDASTGAGVPSSPTEGAGVSEAERPRELLPPLALSWARRAFGAAFVAPFGALGLGFAFGFAAGGLRAFGLLV